MYVKSTTGQYVTVQVVSKPRTAVFQIRRKGYSRRHGKAYVRGVCFEAFLITGSMRKKAVHVAAQLDQRQDTDFIHLLHAIAGATPGL